MANGSSHNDWSIELEKGLHSLRLGEFDDAKHHFERAHRSDPNQPLVQYALGRELARAGKFGEAKSLLRAAWSGDRSLIGAAATLARGLGLDEGDFAAADTLLDEASSIGAEVATLEIVRAELLIERGDYKNAREAASRATQEDSSELVALGAKAVLVHADNLEGVALAASGEYEEALFCFRRARIGDPSWAAPALNSALAFEALGRSRPAHASASKALELDPDNAGAIALRARLLFREGRDHEATSELAQAVETHPEATDLAVMLAEMCAAGGDVETASSILADLLAQYPTDTQAWLTLGRAQASAGAIGAAEECLRQALELEPENPDAMTILADLLVRDGRFFEAAGLAQRAQGLAPAARSRYVRSDQDPATRRGRTR